MRLFEMYKEKYTLEIERNHKEIEMKVRSTTPSGRRYWEAVLGE